MTQTRRKALMQGKATNEDILFVVHKTPNSQRHRPKKEE